MCEFCGCSGVRTKQDANGIARRRKKRISIPVATISSTSKAPKISAAGFRKTPATGPDGRIETDESDDGNAKIGAS